MCDKIESVKIRSSIRSMEIRGRDISMNLNKKNNVTYIFICAILTLLLFSINVTDANSDIIVQNNIVQITDPIIGRTAPQFYNSFFYAINMSSNELFKTTDETLWTDIGTIHLPAGYNIASFTYDDIFSLQITSKGTFFLSLWNTSNSYLFRSTDGINYIEVLDLSGGNRYARTIAEDGAGNLFFGTYYSGTVFYNSQDDGLTWSQMFDDKDKHNHYSKKDPYTGDVWTAFGDSISNTYRIKNNSNFATKMWSMTFFHTDQYIRVTSIVATEDNVLFGQDQENWGYVYSWNKSTHGLDGLWLAPLKYRNPVWNMEYVDGVIYIAIGQTPGGPAISNGSVWASPDKGKSFVRLFELNVATSSNSGVYYISDGSVDGKIGIRYSVDGNPKIAFFNKLSIDEIKSFQKTHISNDKIKYKGRSIYSHSFENTTAGWSLSNLGAGTWGTTNNTSYDGDYSFYYNKTDNNTRFIKTNPATIINIPAGQTITLEASVNLSRNSITNDPGIVIIFQPYFDDSTTDSSWFLRSKANTSWIRLYDTKSYSKNIVNFTIYVYFYNSTTYYLDGISVMLDNQPVVPNQITIDIMAIVIIGGIIYILTRIKKV